MTRLIAGFVHEWHYLLGIKLHINPFVGITLLVSLLCSFILTEIIYAAGTRRAIKTKLRNDTETVRRSLQMEQMAVLIMYRDEQFEADVEGMLANVKPNVQI